MNILVVDDDLVTGALLKKVLSKQGYAVTHVTDGAKALEALEKDPCRIILTDWMMPGMDGPTLCRHIRALDRQHYIYIILLTAKNSKDDAVAGLESGADDYIVKPFDKLELLARIRAGRRLVDLEDSKRETQEKLSRSEKLAAVGHLAAGVAHEINNPIGFISSNLSSLGRYMGDINAMVANYRELVQTLDRSIASKTMDAALPGMVKRSVKMEQECDIDFLVEDTGELVTDCLDGAERIKTIVHEMRYFAHPEKQSIEPCRINTIIEKVVECMAPRLPEQARCENHVEPLPEIPCNIPHMEQAFSNIIQNAMDAMESPGEIIIAGRISNEAVEVEIRDTGRGISPDHLAHVFDPFFTTQEVGKGVGLGLTTALNIVKMHNGTITCQSEPGKPTIFTVSLPIPGESSASL